LKVEVHRYTEREKQQTKKKKEEKDEAKLIQQESRRKSKKPGFKTHAGENNSRSPFVQMEEKT